MTRFLAVLGIAFAMVLAACTDNDQPDSGADGASEAVETIPDRPDNSEPVPAQGAQRNIDEALAWVVSFANGAELTEAEYTDRFEDEFRRQVPYSQMLLVQHDIGLQGPWQLIAAETTDYQAGAEAQSATLPLSILHAHHRDRNRV